MEAFTKPLRKRPLHDNAEPEGLDAFASGAPRPFPIRPELVGDRPEPEPEPEPECYGMNIRFTATEKATLVALAKNDSRSQHQIVKRLLAPVLAAAGAELAAPGSKEGRGP